MPTYTQGLNKKGGEYQLKLEVTQKSQSVANNTSSVYGRAYIYKNSSSARTGNWNNNNSSWNMNIGGNTRSGSIKYDFRNRANYGSQDLGSGTWTIGHNSNGTKSISVSASFSDNGGAIGSGSISKSMTLTTIPRKSKVTRYVLNSRTLNSLNIGWSADKAISQTSWRVNGGSWNTVNASGTSGSFTVGGLSPGGSYSVDFQVKNRDSGLWSDNMNLKASTYARATATVGNWNLSNNVTANISRAHGSIYSDVSLQMWGDSQKWIHVDTVRNATTSATFVMNDSKRAVILQNRRYSKTFSFRVQVTSKWGTGGGSQGTTTSNQATGTINTVGNPTMGTLSYYDETASTVAITGDKLQLIQNQSSLVLSISSFKSNGYAYLTRALMTVGGTTSQINLSGSSEGTRTVRLGKINSGSNATVSVTVYDSRGQTSSKSITVKMIPYAPPAVINLKPAREHGYEEPSYLRATPRISHINRKNTGKFRYRIKQTTTSTWGAWQEVPISSPSVSGNYFNYSVNRYMADYPNDREYNIETQVSDRIYGWTGTTSAILRRGIPLLKFEETKLTAGVTFNAAKGIHIPDTRNDNNPPSWYYTNYPYSHTIEFKFRDKIGVPGSGLYVSLHTITRWGDKSGGNVTQTAYTDTDVYYRTGEGSSWGSWRKLFTDEGGVVNGGLEAKGSITASGNLYQHGHRVVDFNSTPDTSGGTNNFNNYWKAGAVLYTSSGNASSAPNSPKLGAGRLVTYTNGDYTNASSSQAWLYSTQVFTTLGGQVATRGYSTDRNGKGSWSNWRKFLREDDIPNPIKDHIIETGSNSNGSWRKWSSGLIEMWGSGNYANSSDADKRSKVTLPTSCKFEIGRDMITVQGRNYSPSIPTYIVFEPTNTYFLVMGKHLTSQGWVETKNIYWNLKSRWK